MLNKDETAKKFAEKLAIIMKEKGMSGNELAKQVGIDRASISKYLQNESTPKVDTFLSICDVLNVEPNYFLDIQHEDYVSDSTKTTERKIIESLFFLMDEGIIYKRNNDYGESFYVVANSQYLLNEICEDCERYAGSDFVQSEQICNKIVLKYEKELNKLLKQIEKASKNNRNNY